MRCLSGTSRTLRNFYCSLCSKLMGSTMSHLFIILCFFRYFPSVIAENTEDTLISWLLVTVCSSHMIKNPYLVAKLIEVIFVIIPSIQPRCEPLYLRLMSHHITCTVLPSSLMKFYTDVSALLLTQYSVVLILCFMF